MVLLAEDEWRRASRKSGTIHAPLSLERGEEATLAHPLPYRRGY